MKGLRGVFTSAVSFSFLFSVPDLATANNGPFTCSELAVFARGLTVARDNGTPLTRVKQIIGEDSSFTASDKESFKKVATSIYQSPSIGPDAMAALARQECLKTGKRRP